MKTSPQIHWVTKIHGVQLIHLQLLRLLLSCRISSTQSDLSRMIKQKLVAVAVFNLNPAVDIESVRVSEETTRVSMSKVYRVVFVFNLRVGSDNLSS